MTFELFKKRVFSSFHEEQQLLLVPLEAESGRKSWVRKAAAFGHLDQNTPSSISAENHTHTRKHAHVRTHTCTKRHTNTHTHTHGQTT